MFKFCILGLSMILASLFSFFEEKPSTFDKDMAKMNEVVNTSIKQLNERYGLISVGRGGSEKDYKSNREFIAFKINRKLTIEEARILIIEIVELLLNNINNNTEINHFLYNNPFTYKNIETVVYIYDKGSDTFHPNIGLVSLTRRGTINFVTYEPNTEYEYATDVEEPYEEAYKIATSKGYPNPQFKSPS